MQCNAAGCRSITARRCSDVLLVYLRRVEVTSLTVTTLLLVLILLVRSLNSSTIATIIVPSGAAAAIVAALRRLSICVLSEDR